MLMSREIQKTTETEQDMFDTNFRTREDDNSPVFHLLELPVITCS